MRRLVWLVWILLIPVYAFPQQVTIIGGCVGNTLQCRQVNIDANGNLGISGSISGGNPAASPTGSAVPAQGSYNAINVGGTLRGQTGTNPSGSIYAADVNIASSTGNLTVVGTGSFQVQVSSVPSDPFGANADAACTAGSTGSMQCKLRLMTSQIDTLSTTLTTTSSNVSTLAGTVHSGALNMNYGNNTPVLPTDIADVNLKNCNGSTCTMAFFGVGATGSAPPANANFLAGLASGATGGLLGGYAQCDDQAFLDMTTATTTELVPLTSGRIVQVCYWLAESNGTTTMTFKRGTGTNCGTGTTSISPAWDLTAQTGFSGGSGIGAIFDNRTASNALCVTNGSAVNLHIFVRFAKY
jgi:hypothetical protein